MIFARSGIETLISLWMYKIMLGDTCQAYVGWGTASMQDVLAIARASACAGHDASQNLLVGGEDPRCCASTTCAASGRVPLGGRPHTERRWEGRGFGQHAPFHQRSRVAARGAEATSSSQSVRGGLRTLRRARTRAQPESPRPRPSGSLQLEVDGGSGAPSTPKVGLPSCGAPQQTPRARVEPGGREARARGRPRTRLCDSAAQASRRTRVREPAAQGGRTKFSSRCRRLCVPSTGPQGFENDSALSARSAPWVCAQPPRRLSCFGMYRGRGKLVLMRALSRRLIDAACQRRREALHNITFPMHAQDISRHVTVESWHLPEI